MSVSENLLPTYTKKTLNAMKTERAVKRITFDKTEANPGDMLYVTVPKLNANEVLVPGSLSLLFDISLSGGQENNFLVQIVTRALVDKLVVYLEALSCKTRLGMTSTKSLKTFSFRRNSERT